MGATQIVPREMALLESIGQPFAQIAAEIGMSLSMLRNWPMAHLHQIDAKEGPETALETLTKKTIAGERCVESDIRRAEIT